MVIEALAARRDGAAALAARAPRAAVVGGFVRDTLLGSSPREIDIVVEGDAAALAHEIGGTVTEHAAFGTARVERDGWSIDIAMARTETYSKPGALPQVAPATLADDLRRRDFSVNAIAVTLAGAEMIADARAADDLAARRLRVLHDAGFVDDPTRVMRLVRYAHRLGFEIDPHTRELADAAAFDSVSGARIGAELRLILAEDDPIAPLRDLAGRLPVTVDRELIERALALTPPDAQTDLVILATVTRERAPQEWIADLELTASERDVVVGAKQAPSLARAIERCATPSELREALRGVPPEVVAIAGALGPAQAAARWLSTLRHVALDIGGDDLLAAGVPAGVEIGARLDRTLRRKLDGELTGGRDVELASALGEEA